MRSAALTGILVLTCMPALAAELPAAVAAAVKEREAACAKNGGRATSARRFVRRLDLDRDGADDFILDDGRFRCSKCPTEWCGSGGSSREIYLSSAKDKSKPLLVERGGSYGVRKSRSGARVTFQTRNGYVTYRFAKGCAVPVSGPGERRC